MTGGAGFVGRHMVAELLRRGYEVRSFDLDPMRVDVDLRKPPHLHVIEDALELFRTGQHHFDLVVHAAASSPHRAAIDTEPQHLARNLQLDAAMFDWAVRTGQGRVLYLSSSAAYPVGMQTGRTPYRLHENDADPDQPIATELLGKLGPWVSMRPDAVYGWTKLTGEMLAAQARKAGLPVTVVRPFSGYGEDQSENFPFRALVERARRREDPFLIWGDGRQVRDWIHISDVVAGALAVVESGTEDPVNLCTGVGTSMRELAELACAQVGYRPDFALLTDKPAGVAYRVGDPYRFRKIYKPTVTLAEGVARALASTESRR